MTEKRSFSMWEYTLTLSGEQVSELLELVQQTLDNFREEEAFSPEEAEDVRRAIEFYRELIHTIEAQTGE